MENSPEYPYQWRRHHNPEMTWFIVTFNGEEILREEVKLPYPDGHGFWKKGYDSPSVLKLGEDTAIKCFRRKYGNL